MNVEYANTIPLSSVFDKMGFKPLKQDGNKLYFLAPFRDEVNPSIIVDTHTNVWEDTITKTSGNVIDLVCLYLKYTKADHTFHDAGRWVENMFGCPSLPVPEGVPDYSQEDKKYKFKEVHPLTDLFLIKYLEEEMGIPLEIASTALNEVDIINKSTGNTFTALGIKKVYGGYAFFNHYTKGQVGKQALSIVGENWTDYQCIHIFKDVLDYLAALTILQKIKSDDHIIILNSLQNLPHSVAYIRKFGYKKAYTWFDNTPTGIEATNNFNAFSKTEPDLIHVRMNRQYTGFKDMSAMHIGKRSHANRKS